MHAELVGSVPSQCDLWVEETVEFTCTGALVIIMGCAILTQSSASTATQNMQTCVTVDMEVSAFGAKI